MPGYPPLAWSGRITGHGTAAVDLDSTGILDIRTANLHPLLASEVVKSIRSSQFADCGPRQLALEYDFVMEGKEAISTAITVIVLSGSHFMIKVNPPKAME
ncbi:MAG TPA: hypothetical protein VKS44_17150 [Candidatus Acidoferrales bacterium]|nr:hypothetical protein [Candidatus Acidoferrales bacterium]